jgi:hypothetical protein
VPSSDTTRPDEVDIDDENYYVDVQDWYIQSDSGELDRLDEMATRVHHRHVQINFPLIRTYGPQAPQPGEVLSYMAAQWRRPVKDGSVVTVHRLLKQLSSDEEEGELPPVMLTVSNDWEVMADEKRSVFLEPKESKDLLAMLQSATTSNRPARTPPQARCHEDDK